ncbi:hypothetical protein CDAR_195181 [Caerostris darwini]|uniref:Uncharacterized protein n=1 Tax=Caerostris darwini TaxID=1538125 RepID=A0AAV4X5P6_9ARAC|nr:hypothetical protein CDAR_195181 [Caerostris darwini]
MNASIIILGKREPSAGMAGHAKLIHSSNIPITSLNRALIIIALLYLYGYSSHSYLTTHERAGVKFVGFGLRFFGFCSHSCKMGMRAKCLS